MTVPRVLLIGSGLAGAFLLSRASTHAATGSGQAPVRSALPDRVADFTSNQARRQGIPSEIAVSVLWNESAGDGNAVGASGEKGFFQLTEAAVQDVATKTGVEPLTGPTTPVPFGPINSAQGRSNIETGVAFLALQRDRMDSWFDALRAYQCGVQGARSNPNCAASEARERLRDARRPDLLP